MSPANWLYIQYVSSASPLLILTPAASSLPLPHPHPLTPAQAENDTLFCEYELEAGEDGRTLTTIWVKDGLVLKNTSEVPGENHRDDRSLVLEYIC